MSRILGTLSFAYRLWPIRSIVLGLLVAHGSAQAVVNPGTDLHAVLRKVRALPAATAPGESPQALVFGGQVSGKLQNARTQCTFLDATQGFALYVAGTLAREKLELFVNLTGGFNGPGVYPIGSVLGQNGQAALSYRNGAYTSDALHPGSLQVNPDGHSGTISANMGGASVTGAWSCRKLGSEQERLTTP